MSIDPEKSTWETFYLGLEDALKNSTNESELNTKIQSLFKKITYKRLETESCKIDALNSLTKRTKLPLTSTIATNVIDQKISSTEWEAIEQKFALLQKTYPSEFAEVLKALQKEFSLPSAILYFKKFILEFFKVATEKHHYDIEEIINLLEDYNFKELEKIFIEYIFEPLANRVRKKFNNKEKVGLRSKPPEIQAKFLEGKSQQIESVKQQYLEQKRYAEIFKDSCIWRSNLAFICLDPDAGLFGELRTTLEDNKPGSGNFVSGFKESKAPRELIEKCEALIKEEPDHGENPVFPDFVKVGRSQRTIYGQINSEKIPLTRLNQYDGGDLYMASRDRFPGLNYRHSWTHTEPQYINQCMSHIDALYQKLLNATSPDQKLNLIARIHWWGCQACPCARGSAAIMEVICQGLLEGSKLPFRLDPNKPVDIYALTEPNEDQFVKDYVSLLQSTELD